MAMMAMDWPAGWMGGTRSMAAEVGITRYSTPGTGGLSSDDYHPMTIAMRRLRFRRGRALRKLPEHGARPGWLERPLSRVAALRRRRARRSRRPWAVRVGLRLFPT